MTLGQLLEGIGPRKLYHFTDYHSLEDILASGKLKGYKYVGTPEGTLQIATVRKSMANPKNLESLGSGTTGGVKFTIDASIASDKIRGLKVKTIAELPLNHMSDMKKADVRYGNEIYKYKKVKEVYQKAKKLADEKGYELSPNSHNSLNNVKTIAMMLKDDFKFSMNKFKNIDIIENMLRHWILMGMKSKKREGEERLTFKNKKDGIDLDKSFIKIELLKPPNKYEISAKLKSLMKENKELFKINDVYKKTLEMKAPGEEKLSFKNSETSSPKKKIVVKKVRGKKR